MLAVLPSMVSSFGAERVSTRWFCARALIVSRMSIGVSDPNQLREPNSDGKMFQLLTTAESESPVIDATPRTMLSAVLSLLPLVVLEPCVNAQPVLPLVLMLPLESML